MPENVQSVVRAFELLRRVAEHDGPVALGELAGNVGLAKSTTRRLLSTLEELGMVERSNGTYAPGPGLSLFRANAGDVNIHQLAQPFVRDVVDAVSEAATLAVRDGDFVVFAHQVAGPNPVQVPDETGMRYPLHTVASGYLFLGDFGAKELKTYCRNNEVDNVEVSAAVEAGRTNGYVWHDGWLDGITALAAPVRERNGKVVAALGAFGPTYRFGHDRKVVGESVRGIANRLATYLGP